MVSLFRIVTPPPIFSSESLSPDLSVEDCIYEKRGMLRTEVFATDEGLPCRSLLPRVAEGVRSFCNIC